MYQPPPEVKVTPSSYSPAKNKNQNAIPISKFRPSLIATAWNRVTDGDPPSVLDEDQVNRLGVRQEACQDLDSASVNSFNEIVGVSAEGHTFIDINRLVFNHQKSGPALVEDTSQQSDRLLWYIPDFTFIIFNLMSLALTTYFIMSGLSILAWKGNMGMFTVPSCDKVHLRSKAAPLGYQDFFEAPCKAFMDHPEISKRYNLSLEINFPILRTKIAEVHYFGLFLVALEIFSIVNAMVGINACIQGYKSILIQHITVDCIIIICEFTISGVVAVTATCGEPDGSKYPDVAAVRILMEHFLKQYKPDEMTFTDSSKQKQVAFEMDTLQIGLECCGVDGWEDHVSLWHKSVQFTDLALYLAQISHVGESVIPPSCCKPWWIRNIYCAVNAHFWPLHPENTEPRMRFDERIVQYGCLTKLQFLCDSLKHFLGIFGVGVATAHLIFVMVEGIGVLIIIRNINALIQEKKKAIKRKELLHEAGESGSDLDIRTPTAKVSAKSLRMTRASRVSLGQKALVLAQLPDRTRKWSHIAPPTEDEIYTIKERTNFNRFITRLKHTRVSTWMHDAQGQVTQGSSEMAVLAPTTAEERKARDKELLHKQKKADHAQAEHEHQQHEHEQQRQRGWSLDKHRSVMTGRGDKKKKDKRHHDESTSQSSVFSEPSPSDIQPLPEGLKDEGPQKIDKKERKGLSQIISRYVKVVKPPPPPPPPPKKKKLRKKTTLIWKKGEETGPTEEATKSEGEELALASSAMITPPDTSLLSVNEDYSRMTTTSTEGETTEGEEVEETKEQRRKRRRRRWRKRRVPRPGWKGYFSEFQSLGHISHT